MSLLSPTRFFFLLFLFSGVGIVYSQPKKLAFDHLNVESGLPESQVNGFLQDTLGYIWMGTQNGLVRYDGSHLKIYKVGSEDKKALNYFLMQGLYEDPQGNLWATEMTKGLFRYDRAHDRFIEYAINKPGYATDRGGVYDLNSSRDGSLWFLVRKTEWTNQSVVNRILPNGKVLHYGFNEEGAGHLRDSVLTSILKDKQGVIHIFGEKAIYRFDSLKNKLVTEYNFPDSITRKGIHISVSRAATNNRFFLLGVHSKTHTNLGLMRYQPATHQLNWLRYSPKDHNGLPSDTIGAIIEDKAHRTWVATGKGLANYDPLTGHFTTYSPAGTHPGDPAAIYAILEAPNGSFWCSSVRGLLSFNLQSKQFTRYIHDESDPSSIAANGVNQFFYDRSGSLWVSLNFAGVDRLNKQQSNFTVYKGSAAKKEGYPGGASTGIVLSRNDDLWVANAKGVFRKPAGTDLFISVKLPFKTSADISLLYCDRKDRLWLTDRTSEKSFVYDIASGSAEEIKPTNNEILGGKNAINVVYEDHNGLFWLGYFGNGLTRYNEQTNKITHFPFVVNRGTTPSGDKLDDDDILSIYEDRENTLWIGTNNGGLSSFDPRTGKFRSFYNGHDGMQCVVDSYEDRKGRFWVATYLNGLFLFDRKLGKPIKHLDESTGLLADYAATLLEDPAGKIWIYSARGFSVIDPRNFSIKTYRYPYGVPDVFIGREAAIDKKGLFYIVINDGILTFLPEGLVKNIVPPQLAIESVVITDDQANSHNTLYPYDTASQELSHTQNRITFNYVAFHYTNAALNTYSYKLEGYDPRWIYAGTQQAVTYTNLSPGTYTFKVKAANSDGIWAKKGASFIVIIRPPWWKTWWAMLIELLVFLSIIRAFIAWRSKQLLRENRELEEKIEERTHQLKEQQEEITAQRDHLSQTIDDLKVTQSQLIQSEKMASLGELTAGIAHEIQNPLNFVNNFSEVSIELISEMETELVNDNKDDAIAIASDIKQNLEKISHHGKRADSIVKGMLQHSRAGSGQKEPADINQLADEYLRLSYHGLRAKDKSFNAAMVTEYDPEVGMVPVNPQDLGRVILNMLNNAFYSVVQKKKTAPADYAPEVTISTKRLKEFVEIRIRDNGTGIPKKVLDKMYQPFFTTKPTGEGTGLGLSLSYDIISNGHGGELAASSKEGEFAEFTIRLPVKAGSL